MRGKHNSNVHLYEQLCTADINLQCDLHSDTCTCSGIDLPCTSDHGIMPDTDSGEYSVCNMACQCNDQRRMQFKPDQ